MIGLLSPDEYYTAMQYGSILNQSYQIGQFFWAPSLFLFGERQPYLLRSSYSEARSAYEYSVDRIRQGEFNNPEAPNHTLGTRSDERSVIIGAKRRPVILISRAAAMWSDSRRRQDDSFLVAPVYSFGGDETRLTYSQTFIERVKGYEYWQLLYLPAHTRSRIRESFVRLDRIQAIHKDLLEYMPLMLSDDAQHLLHSWIRVYLGEDLASVDDILFDYREQAIANLP